MLQVRRLPQVTIPEILLPHDEEAARLNIEKAAYLGFAKAQLEMGAAYELCSLGCEFDPALSLHYNALAARQGEPEAEMAISKWFLCGYEGVFQKNEELAYVYAERAAQSGLSTAEFAMGYFSEIGIHLPINLEKAREWYEKAAANGNQDATQRIESLKNDQSLSKQDHEQVAINRIKSQYGSRRGGRPDRFKSQAPPMPTMDEAGNRPPRVSSVAPYPMSEQPPQIPRPSTTAPYPTADGPPLNRGPGPAGGFFDPSSQPNPSKARHSSASAFHVNPQMYGQQQRPSTTVNDMRGRPNQGGPLQRQPSGPPPFAGRPGGPDMGYHNGPPGPHGLPGRANSLSPRPGPQPMQDIGFVAPLQPRRPSPNQQGGRPMQQGGSPVYPPNAATPRPMQGPPGGPGGFGGPGGPGPGGVQRPPRGDSRQPGVGGRASARPGGPPGPGGPKPPPAGSGLAPPKQITANGPKTFAEMGIPAQQKEGECVSLVPSVSGSALTLQIMM
jgi:hypothetical protein